MDNKLTAKQAWAITFGQEMKIGELPTGTIIEEDCGCRSVIREARHVAVFIETIKGCEHHENSMYAMDPDDVAIPVGHETEYHGSEED